MNEMKRAIERAKTERENRPEIDKIREYEKSLYEVRRDHNFYTISLEDLLRVTEMMWAKTDVISDFEQVKENFANLRIFADITKRANIQPTQPPAYQIANSPYPATPNVNTWILFGHGIPPRGMNEGHSCDIRMTAEGDILRNGHTSDKALDGKRLTASMAEIVVKNGLNWPSDK